MWKNTRISIKEGINTLLFISERKRIIESSRQTLRTLAHTLLWDCWLAGNYTVSSSLKADSSHLSNMHPFNTFLISLAEQPRGCCSLAYSMDKGWGPSEGCLVETHRGMWSRKLWSVGVLRHPTLVSHAVFFMSHIRGYAYSAERADDNFQGDDTLLHQ